MSEENIPASEQPSCKSERLKAFATVIINKCDALYNKLPLDKINEKFKGKIDVKTRKFKTVLSVVVCLLFVFCLKSCFGGNIGKKLKPSQITRAEKYLYDNFQFGMSLESGGGLLPPRIQKTSVKYMGRKEIGYNEYSELAGIAGEKGNIFKATAIYKATTSYERYQSIVIIIIHGNKVLCIPANKYF